MNAKITPVLVVLLVVVSFLAGSMYTRVRTLESNDSTKGEKTQAQLTPAPSPTPVILNETQREEIETGGAAVKGSDDAKVTIVEFSEYECPYCQRYVDSSYGQIMEEYGDKIKYVFHDFPLSLHQHAKAAANGARCAGEQDKYWEMHDILFAKRDEWAGEEDIIESLTAYAQELGLDTASYAQCIKDNKYEEQINQDTELGRKVSVSGTPSFFINGIQLVGAHPFENFKALIDQELAK